MSVIVPIFNGESDLPDLLQALKSQTYPPDRLEFVLVDNQSRDRTPALLQAAIPQFAQHHLTLNVLSESTIQSSYAARNRGIKASIGSIVAFTDCDCRPQPTWLTELVQPFADPTVAIAAGEIMALPGHTPFESYAERRKILSQKHTLAHPFLPYGQTANLAVRRNTLEQSGLFRPYLTTGGDADLCWRILQQGAYQIKFASNALVSHRHRSNLNSLREQWYRYGQSNRYLHDLHHVDLMRELHLNDYLHRWNRWLLKEVPLTVKKMIMGQASWFDMLDTPIDLYCIYERSRGQRESSLPSSAHSIDWLYPPAEP